MIIEYENSHLKLVYIDRILFFEIRPYDKIFSLTPLCCIHNENSIFKFKAVVFERFNRYETFVTILNEVYFLF